jgi:CelD/BcsL family acetyltransferase involved in cellulose biosynthesis
MTAIADSLGRAPALRDAAGAARVPMVALNPVSLAQWDDLAAGFMGLCQEQLLAFAGVRWPRPAHEPVAFSIGGEVVGGALVMVQRLPLGLGQVAFTKWGPMLADTNRPDASMVYAAMIEALIAEYSVGRGMMLSVMTPASTAGSSREYALLMDRGFRPGVLLNYPLRYLVNLRLGDAEQRKSFEPAWRRQLNKADASGLSFERGGAERLPEFTALYEQMLERKRFTDYSAYETIPHLFALENERARPELFFVRKDGKVVAGAIIFKGGERAVYLYGATLDSALPLRAGYFLHWNIIRWLRDHTGAQWYDLGGTDGYAGLHQFKKGMVGAAGIVTPVPRTANYADRKLAFLVGNTALWAREGMHEVLRQASRLRPGRAQPTLPRFVEIAPGGKN